MRYTTSTASSANYFDRAEFAAWISVERTRLDIYVTLLGTITCDGTDISLPAAVASQISKHATTHLVECSHHWVTCLTCFGTRCPRCDLTISIDLMIMDDGDPDVFTCQCVRTRIARRSARLRERRLEHPFGDLFSALLPDD